MDILTLPEMVGFCVVLLASLKLELREVLLGGKVVTFLVTQRENLDYK